MVHHELSVLDDADALAARAAAFVARASAADVVRARRPVHLRRERRPHPVGHVRRLAAEDVPWADVVIYQVDERVAPEGDPDRNLAHLRESLGDAPARVAAHAGGRPRDLDGGGGDLRFVSARAASTWSTWDSAPTATRRPWSPATRSSMSPTGWSG